MFPGPDVITERPAHRGVHCRHRRHSQPRLSVQRVDPLGAQRGQKFATRIRPLVAHRTRHVERPRRDQRQQLVLVHGQRRFVVVVTAEIFRKPVRKFLIYDPHRLAVDALAQRRPATAALVGDHEREPLVLRPGPKRRFAQPRMSVQRDPLRVHRGVRLQIIERATQSPSPRADRAPRIARPVLGAAGSKESRHALRQTANPIRREVVAPGRGHGIAARDHRLDLPAFRVGSALLRLFFRLRINRPVTLRVVDRVRLRQRDAGVGVHRVVAEKIEPEKNRRRRHMVGHVEQEIHPGAVGFAGEPQRDLLARGLAAERGAIDGRHLGPHRRRPPRWRAPVDLSRKQLQQLRPPPGAPRSGVAHRRAVGHHERIGQRVGRDFGLVGVSGLGCGGHVNRYKHTCEKRQE